MAGPGRKAGCWLSSRVGYPCQPTAYSRTGSSNPLRSAVPRSLKSNPLPAASSLPTFETRISPASAWAQMRAASWTALPNRSSSSATGSPALRPIRTRRGESGVASQGPAQAFWTALGQAGGGGERGHDPVPRVLNLGAAVHTERLANDCVVGAEHILGSGVAQALGQRGGTLHVRKQDGLEPAAHLRPGLRPFLAAQELLDGADQRLCVPQRDDVDVALPGHGAG